MASVVPPVPQLVDTCIPCHSPLARDIRSGEKYCPNCGLVVSDVPIDLGERLRIGQSLSGSSEAMGEVSISRFNRDHMGHRVDFSHRLRIAEDRSHKNRRMDYRPLLYNIVRQLELPSPVAVRAAEIRLRAHEQRLLKGRRIDVIADACIFLAAREFGIFITLRRIGKTTSTDWCSIGNLARRLSRNLHLKSRAPTAEDYLRQMALSVNVPRDVRDRSIEFARDLLKRKTTVGPNTLAAAIAWKMWGHPRFRTKTETARLFDITEVSLRSAIRAVFG